jgi:integrative and conjugative element protein (TIGR02256 family)
MIRLWVAKSAARVMEEMADLYSPREAGGVLLGYRVGTEVVVEIATPPGPGARHADQSYDPDPDHDRTLVSRVYAESGRRTTYLGDWHSHPGEGPFLSRRDRRTLCRIARTASARAPSPVMIVLAQPDPPEWVLAGWFLDEVPRFWFGSASVTRVEPRLFDS